ncbi:leucyl aminopeptidase [Bacillus cereus Rock1-15]|nr:leucyl aminopeptidase [Bacillus cereus Rock1-15]
MYKIPFEKGSTVCFFTEPSASLFSGKPIVTLRRVPSSRLTSVIVLMKEY